MKDLLIAACLAYVLWTVAYLFWERFFRRSPEKQQTPQKPIPEIHNDDDIIGKSTFLMSHLMPQTASSENQKNGTQMKGSFAASSETKPPVKVPDDQLDEAFSHNRDDNQPMNICVSLEYESNQDDDEDEESWLTGNVTLAEGSTFEEMGVAVRTVVHHQTATLSEKEQAGGTLLEIRQTDMFEQLVQSAPERKDIVSEVISLHLAAYHHRLAERNIVDHGNTEGKTPSDFDIKNFV